MSEIENLFVETAKRKLKAYWDMEAEQEMARILEYDFRNEFKEEFRQEYEKEYTKFYKPEDLKWDKVYKPEDLKWDKVYKPYIPLVIDRYTEEPFLKDEDLMV